MSKTPTNFFCKSTRCRRMLQTRTHTLKHWSWCRLAGTGDVGRLVSCGSWSHCTAARWKPHPGQPCLTGQ
eukprot:2314186-Amphidinium_carterae.1